MGEEGKPSPPFKILCVFSPALLTTSDSCRPVCALADVLLLLVLAVVYSRRKTILSDKQQEKLLVSPPLVSRDSLLPLLSLFLLPTPDRLFLSATYLRSPTFEVHRPHLLPLPPPSLPISLLVQQYKNAVFNFAPVEQESESDSLPQVRWCPTTMQVYWEFSVSVRNDARRLQTALDHHSSHRKPATSLLIAPRQLAHYHSISW